MVQQEGGQRKIKTKLILLGLHRLVPTISQQSKGGIDQTDQAISTYTPFVHMKCIVHFSCITRPSNTVIPPIGGISIQFMTIIPHI